MALKFLNKKGWHTGSLRNIETVWKAEQKHEAEQRKLEELRKQIHEEREKHEFRLLQEQAGLQPRQERLDFLYESGLAVGKGSSEGFQALKQATPAAAASSSQADNSSAKSAAPGALFEDKPQSANDAWRKLHSDPLLLIRQREQEAIARIKNNPIKMAQIKKSVEVETKQKEDKKEKHEKRRHKKHHHSETKSKKHRSNDSSDSEVMSDRDDDRRKERNYLPEGRQDRRSKHEKQRRRDSSDSECRQERSSKLEKHHRRDMSDSEDDEPKRKRRPETLKHDERSHRDRSDLRSTVTDSEDRRRRHYSPSDSRQRRSEDGMRNIYSGSERRPHPELGSEYKGRQESQACRNSGPGFNRRRGVHHMSEEEREARLRQMQLDGELHEEQRWKRLKRAADDDAKESASATASSTKGKNFLDDAQKSIYGTEKGGSATIEESVRRRAFYLQGGSDAHDGNAFRR